MVAASRGIESGRTFYQAKRVLVTGGSGFIGSHLVPILVSLGFEVHAARRSDVVPADGVAGPDGVYWVSVDLLDPLASLALMRFVQPDILVHLAWVTDHGHYWDDWRNWSWREATTRLMEQFIEAGGSRAVVAGTCAEYLWHHSAVMQELGTPMVPATAYGQAKLATSQDLGRLADAAGTELAWARIFNLYGPGEHPERLVPYVIRALLAGRTAHVGGGSSLRDFMYVQDVAAALASLVASSVCGPINVATGEGVAIADLVGQIAIETGNPSGLRLDGQPRAGDPAALIADVTRLSQEVGFRPSWDLSRGVAATVDWWRRQESDHSPADVIVEQREAGLTGGGG
jgi:nucleoside-diphosphate-sugar epimerase